MNMEGYLSEPWLTLYNVLYKIFDSMKGFFVTFFQTPLRTFYDGVAGLVFDRLFPQIGDMTLFTICLGTGLSVWVTITVIKWITDTVGL